MQNDIQRTSIPKENINNLLSEEVALVAKSSVQEALLRVLREKFEVWEDAEMITHSSLTYRPDAFFISPQNILFIVEVKKDEVTIDHLRILMDFCSDLQPTHGSSIEVIISSPKEMKPEVRKYNEAISSKQPFRFHFIQLTPEKAAHINSLNKGSAELKQSSMELLKEIF